MSDIFILFSFLLRPTSKMPMFTCPSCKRAIPCVHQGEGRKRSVLLRVSWHKDPLTVINRGENCYPCPLCEDPDGSTGITHWDNADLRLHKRLRQHFGRHHQQPMPKGAEFQDKARDLRCQLIHGPQGETSPSTSPSTSKATPSTGVKITRAFHPIRLLPAFVEYIEGAMKGGSVTSYLSIARKFLTWVQKESGEEPTLHHAWNFDYVQGFLNHSKETLAPSTIFNYLCGIMSMQKYIVIHTDFEPTKKVDFAFNALLRSLNRGKAAHKHVVQNRKKNSSVKLYEVKRQILKNPDLHHRYAAIINTCKEGTKNISQQNYAWATGYAIFALQAQNFKRNGNICRIEYAPAMKQIKSALKNHKPCEIEITDASKSGGSEIFSIVSRRHLKTLYHYGQYLRPTAMGNGKCKDFFLNSVGTRIVRICSFISNVGKSANLPNLTIRDLRSRVETEAALTSSQETR